MAEPRAIEPDDTGAPARAAGAIDGNGAAAHDAVVRVLRPGETLPADTPRVPDPAHPITWLAPADPAFVVLRDDLRDDLYDDLRDDLAEDLRDDLGDDLRHDLKADFMADLEMLREDLYEEIDDLRDDVFPDGDDAPGTVLPAAHFQADTLFQRARARRVAFVAASVLALVMSVAMVLLWQRSDTARIVAALPTPPTLAPPPSLDNVLSRVDQLDQQLASLLAVSASPSQPSDVSLQIDALRVELSGVRGCLQAVRRAVGAGADTASAIEYC